jgi:hypothetical protein
MHTSVFAGLPPVSRLSGVNATFTTICWCLCKQLHMTLLHAAFHPINVCMCL